MPYVLEATPLLTKITTLFPPTSYLCHLDWFPWKCQCRLHDGHLEQERSVNTERVFRGPYSSVTPGQTVELVQNVSQGLTFTAGMVKPDIVVRPTRRASLLPIGTLMW